MCKTNDPEICISYYDLQVSCYPINITLSDLNIYLSILTLYTLLINFSYFSPYSFNSFPPGSIPYFGAYYSLLALFLYSLLIFYFEENSICN